MKRSLLSSIFCFISLLLINLSYFFLFPFEISKLFIILFFGLLFSLGFLIPAIYAYYREERAKEASRMFFTNQPVGHTFSLLCGIPTIIFGIFYIIDFDIMVGLLWILSGIFALFGLIVYKDDKKY